MADVFALSEQDSGDDVPTYDPDLSPRRSPPPIVPPSMALASLGSSESDFRLKIPPGKAVPDVGDIPLLETLAQAALRTTRNDPEPPWLPPLSLLPLLPLRLCPPLSPTWLLGASFSCI